MNYFNLASRSQKKKKSDIHGKLYNKVKCRKPDRKKVFTDATASSEESSGELTANPSRFEVLHQEFTGTEVRLSSRVYNADIFIMQNRKFSSCLRICDKTHLTLCMQKGKGVLNTAKHVHCTSRAVFSICQMSFIHHHVLNFLFSFPCPLFPSSSLGFHIFFF